MDIQSPDGPMTRVLGQYLAIRSGPKVNESKGNGFEDPRLPAGAGFLLGGTLGRGGFLLGEMHTLCNFKPWSCTNTIAKGQPRLTCFMQVSGTDFNYM
jgi:hypothetical protein